MSHNWSAFNYDFRCTHDITTTIVNYFRLEPKSLVLLETNLFYI